ncbi:uncharacterized protein [Penaeus vannamei]|uniref:uncharacterized protein n=1 Tax=Penaeus vannamei TaxID=6689 RepID=UPI00387F56F1
MAKGCVLVAVLAVGLAIASASSIAKRDVGCNTLTLNASTPLTIGGCETLFAPWENNTAVLTAHCKSHSSLTCDVYRDTANKIGLFCYNVASRDADVVEIGVN